MFSLVAVSAAGMADSTLAADMLAFAAVVVATMVDIALAVAAAMTADTALVLAVAIAVLVVDTFVAAFSSLCCIRITSVAR